MALNRYRVVGRAAAAVIFKETDSITINYPRDGILGAVTLATRYFNRGYSDPVPGDLSVVAEASADSINDAISWMTVGRELASVIAVACNAAIAPVEAELAYDITPGKREREYFQRFMPDDQLTLSTRTVPMDATLALLQAVGNSEHRNRLLRAIMHYDQALQHWGIGNELLIVSHLWIGIEAIAPAYLKVHLAGRGISKSELAHSWGFKPSRGYMEEPEYLQIGARVMLVCQGDEQTYDIARSVSDKYEHGLANGGELFGPSREIMFTAARYLREAIFAVAGIDENDRCTLLGKAYSVQRGPGGLEQYLRAVLVSDSDDLAQDGFPHPYFEWSYKFKDFTLDRENWRYSFEIDPECTARIAPGVIARISRFELWDGGKLTPDDTSLPEE